MFRLPSLKRFSRDLILTVCGSLLAFGLLWLPDLKLLSSVQAADADLDISVIVTVDKDKDYATVKQIRSIDFNRYGYYIPKNSIEEVSLGLVLKDSDSEELQYQKKSLTVKDADGQKLQYNVTTKEDSNLVKIYYPRDLKYNQSLAFVLEYKSHELVEQYGRLVNIYGQGLAKDFKFKQTTTSGLSTQVSYGLTVKHETSLGEKSFISPQPTQQYKQGKYQVYSFNSAKLMGKSVWLQLGQMQIYSFSMKVSVKKTLDSQDVFLSDFAKNVYTLAIPTDLTSVGQTVYLSRLDPVPQEVYRDEDGNTFLKYYLQANQNYNITVDGFVKRDRVELPIDSLKIQTLSGYESEWDSYTQPAQYWPADDSLMKAQAEQLEQKSNQDNLRSLLMTDYNWVVDTLEYDQSRVGAVNNKRSGALQAYNTKKGVCMEYADLLITILRAQGVPARAAFGYGYNRVGGNGQTTAMDLAHQWVQVYIPSFGWMDLDPTWGESDRDFIGADMDHFFWFSASKNPHEPASAGLLSADGLTNVELEAIDFSIVPTTSLDSVSGLEDPILGEVVTLAEAETIIKENNEQSGVANSDNSWWLELQTSVWARQLAFIVPSLLLCIGVTVVIWIVVMVLKRRKR